MPLPLLQGLSSRSPNLGPHLIDEILKPGPHNMVTAHAGMASGRQSSSRHSHGDATLARGRCLHMVGDEAAGAQAKSERPNCVLGGGGDSSETRAVGLGARLCCRDRSRGDSRGEGEEQQIDACEVRGEGGKEQQTDAREVRGEGGKEQQTDAWEVRGEGGK